MSAGIADIDHITPEPWTLGAYGSRIYGSGYSIAIMSGGEVNRDRANAALMASAPIMLRALIEAECAIMQLDEGAMGFVDMPNPANHPDDPNQDYGIIYPLRDELLAQIAAAIAAAKGGNP